MLLYFQHSSSFTKGIQILLILQKHLINSYEQVMATVVRQKWTTAFTIRDTSIYSCFQHLSATSAYCTAKFSTGFYRSNPIISHTIFNSTTEGENYWRCPYESTEIYFPQLSMWRNLENTTQLQRQSSMPSCHTVHNITKS
jgi:hypothetical protein